MKPTAFLSVSQKILHAYNKMCEPLLQEFELSQVSFDILMFLANNPEYSTAQEICEIRHIKKNLVSVHVEKMVCAGLLQRNAVAGDRRKIALSCTEKASPIIDAGLHMQKSFYEGITKGITAEQWEVYKEIHETVEENARQIAES